MCRHIYRLRWLWLIGVASLFATSPAYPWGKGHEIIAAIAEPQLTNAARRRIKELLPQGTTLAEASTWPDKAGRQIPDMDPYHYINFPKDANTYDQQRDCKLRNCVIEAIASYVQVLKSHDAPRNEKRIAIRFVADLVTIYISHFMLVSPRIEAAIVLRCGSMAGKKICTRCGIPALLN
jgi:nuclease S1